MREDSGISLHRRMERSYSVVGHLKGELSRMECAARKVAIWLKENPVGVAKARNVVMKESDLRHFNDAADKLRDAIAQLEGD